MKEGFTLIEIILVVALVAGLSLIVLPFSRTILNRKDLDLALEATVSVLRDAQQRAITQQEGKRWGVHLEHPSGAPDFYVLYKDSYTAANSVQRYNLLESVQFSTSGGGWVGNPPTREVVFQQLSGLITDGSDILITIEFRNGSNQKTITISKDGGTIAY